MSNIQIEWQESALERLKKIPFFIRPFAKSRIEKNARERGVSVIDEKLIDEIKQKEMPGQGS